MPSGVTIATGRFGIATSGPYLNGDDRYLLMMHDSGTSITIEAYKSTDGGDSWSIQDSSNSPALGSGDDNCFMSYVARSQQNASLLWAFAKESGVSGTGPYVYIAIPFDMDTDTWVLADKIIGDLDLDTSLLAGVPLIEAGMQESGGTVRIVYYEYDASLAYRLLPRTAFGDPGDVAWSGLDSVPDLDGTNNLQIGGPSINSAAVDFADKQYIILPIGDNGSPIDAGDSCFSESVTDPLYTQINDFRGFEIDAGVFSGYLAGCLVQSAVGTSGMDLTQISLGNMIVSDGALWHCWNRLEDTGTLAYTVVVKGPNTIGVPTYSGTGSDEFSTGTVENFRPYLVDVAATPVILYLGSDGTLKIRTFDGSVWSAEIQASDLFVGIADTNVYGHETTLGRIGLFQGDKYWEEKLDGDESTIEMPFVASEENVPRPTIILGDAPVTIPKSRWYTY